MTIFNSFADFQGFDFSTAPTVERVHTLGHTAKGIGAATYVKLGTGTSTYNHEGELATSDGSLWTLVSSPISAEHFGALPKGTTIIGMSDQQIRAHNSTCLNRFLIYLSVKDVGTASFGGEYDIESPLYFGFDMQENSVSSTATKHLIGSPRLFLTNTSQVDAIFTINGFRLARWDGRIKVETTRGATWAQRGALYGVKLNGCGRTVFGGFHAYGAAVYGVLCSSELYASGNSSLVRLGDCRFEYCGSGLHGSATSTLDENFMLGTWSNLQPYVTYNSNNNPTTQPAYRFSLIDVDALPTSDMLDRARELPFLTLSNGDFHYIHKIDTANNKLVIRPGIDPNITDRSFRWVFGGGIALRGSDVGITYIDSIDAVNSSLSLDVLTFYGPVVQRIVNHNCFAGAAFQAITSVQTSTTTVSALYTEGNYSAFIGNSANVNILGTYDLDLQNDIHMLTERNHLYENTNNGLAEYTLSKDGEWLQQEKKPLNASDGSSIFEFIIRNKNLHRVYRHNGQTIRLGIDLGRNKLFGYDSGQITFIGTGTNGAPTNTITFRPIDTTNHTVNGQTSWDISSFSGPAIFTVYFDFDNNNFIVATTNKA